MSACASNIPTPPSNQTLQPTTQLQAIKYWRINGKLGIRSTQDNGSVSVNWTQADENYAIRIAGPLGQGNGTITGNRASIHIEQPGKETVSSSTPNALIEDVFGWQLPITFLYYWAQGLTHPEFEVQQMTFDEQGVLTRATQTGWQLTFSRHKISGSEQVPFKVMVEKEDVKLTLIIHSWQFFAQQIGL